MLLPATVAKIGTAVVTGLMPAGASRLWFRACRHSAQLRSMRHVPISLARILHPQTDKTPVPETPEWTRYKLEKSLVQTQDYLACKVSACGPGRAAGR